MLLDAAFCGCAAVAYFAAEVIHAIMAHSSPHTFSVVRTKSDFVIPAV